MMSLDSEPFRKCHWPAADEFVTWCNSASQKLNALKHVT